MKGSKENISQPSNFFLGNSNLAPGWLAVASWFCSAIRPQGSVVALPGLHLPATGILAPSLHVKGWAGPLWERIALLALDPHICENTVAWAAQRGPDEALLLDMEVCAEGSGLSVSPGGGIRRWGTPVAPPGRPSWGGPACKQGELRALQGNLKSTA